MKVPRTVLVTGASGSIGSVVQVRLREDGWKVLCIGDRSDTSPTIHADFEDEEELKAAVETLPSDIHGAVLCHGVLEPGPFAAVDPKRWRRLLEVNLTSTYTILWHLRPRLTRGASLVLISSTAAFDHSPVGGPHYTVSKWALNGLVRHLAFELGCSDTRINAVCPGFVDNDMGRAFISEAELRQGLEEIPLGRAAQPIEVAAAVAFLLSEEASYITGALLPVAGGYR